MSVNLSEKAMLVRLTISQWSARKYDRKVSDKVAQDYGASQDAGRYSKVLIAEEAIKTIAQAANEARTYHYENTLPWRDDGARILPAAQFDRYSKTLREFRSKFDRAVSDFVPRYADFVEHAKGRLNGMFDPSDYPPAHEIADRYAFETAIDPIPDAPDFRVCLQTEDFIAIQASIEARNRVALDAAMRDLWTRLHDTVARVAERLTDPDAIFRDSLITNLQDLCKVLPSLNLTNDPDLTRLADEVQGKLCRFAPETLREHKLTRYQAAQDATAILDAMRSYTGK